MSIEQEWANQNQKMRNEILGRIIPSVTDLWSRKNADYAGQQMFLGLKAQFCDINRKFWKLKAFLWDDKPAEFEDAVEVCKDMIGHLLMTIYFLELEQGKKAVMDIMTSKSEPGFGGILTGTPVVQLRPNEIPRSDLCRARVIPAEHEWVPHGTSQKRCTVCGMVDA